MEVSLVVFAVVMVAALGRAAHASYMARAARVRREMARRRRVRIQETRGGDIRVTGRAVPRGEVLRAPISGRPCVAFLVNVDEMIVDHWVMVLETQDARPFVVADQSGEALVDTGAPYVLDLVRDWEERTDRSLMKRANVVSLLRSESIATSDWLGRPRTFRLREGVLSAGEKVSVAGGSAREPAPDGERPSPREPPERLVLRGTVDEPLFIGDSLEAVEGV